MRFNAKSVTFTPNDGNSITIKPKSVHYDETTTFTSSDVARLFDLAKDYSARPFEAIIYREFFPFDPEPDPDRSYLPGRSLASWFRSRIK